MRPPEAFYFMPVYLLWAGPALGRAQNDHGPLGPLDGLSLGRPSRFLLNVTDLVHTTFHHLGHLAVHLIRIIAFHNVRRPSQASHQHVEFLGWHARQYGWVGNLVSIQMQNGKHGAIAYRVEEFIGVPTGGQRSRL